MGDKHGKMIDDPFKMYEKSELENIQMAHCVALCCKNANVCTAVTQSLTEFQKGMNIILRASVHICDECSCAVDFKSLYS